MGLLEGKTALITGATSGIGREIALRYAREGAAVMLSGRRVERLKALADQIAREGGVCGWHAGDAQDEAYPRRLFDALTARFERLDLLVCSAGMALRAPTLEVTLADWDRVMRVNLSCPMALSQLAVGDFLTHGGGKIVYISSTAAKSVNLGASPSYGASKAALVYLTRHLATEFGGRGVYVNAICPGPVDTEITRSWTPAHRQSVLASLPLGRMGTPADIADCALFLGSSMSDYINGESIMVNGGRYMD